MLDTLIGLIVLIAIFVGGAFIIIYVNKVERKRFDETLKKKEKAAKLYSDTQNAYFNSLSELKNNPNNPELKQQTLKKGRAFSALSRQYQGQNKAVTIYDEMALMNDINAACAGATPMLNSEIQQTLEQRLTKLSELKDKNLISEEEYETRRQKILDEI